MTERMRKTQHRERLKWREREREFDEKRAMYLKREETYKGKKEKPIQDQVLWGFKDLLWDNRIVNFEIKNSYFD